jgi:tetratricopeptide (TPR) repeat protein
MKNTDIDKTINEIYSIYCSRNYNILFTLESINSILEIGNEVFHKNNPEEVKRLLNRPKSKAPDIFDDEPFTLERSLRIFSQFEKDYHEVTPHLIYKIFELNSKISLENYYKKYFKYLKNTAPKYPDDEYLNYLAAVIYYRIYEYKSALKFINLAIIKNPSCAVYIHLKATIYLQKGDMKEARTYLYQALFLMELAHAAPPRKTGDETLYPYFPLEFYSDTDTLKNDLHKLDKAEKEFEQSILPIINSI